MIFDIERKIEPKTVLAVRQGVHGNVYLTANGAIVMTFANGMFRLVSKPCVAGLQYTDDGYWKEEV